MAKRLILTDGDPMLQKVCRAVSCFDEKLHTLLDDMYETMITADGVGLAACQVGILKRAVVISIEEGERIELINPEIISQSGSQNDKEGCLSYPGIYGIVERPLKVEVKAQDRYGNYFTISGKGLRARAFCHEIDHLNGITFIELASEIHDEHENN